MTAAEILQLLDCGKSLPGLYIYDPDRRTACSPDQMPAVQIPWPIEFIARYHPKHVFELKSSPMLKEVGKALVSWEHRARWMVHHSIAESTTDQSHNLWRHLEDPRCRTAYACTHPLPKQ